MYEPGPEVPPHIQLAHVDRKISQIWAQVGSNMAQPRVWAGRVQLNRWIRIDVYICL